MNRSLWLILAALALVAGAGLIRLQSEPTPQTASGAEALPYVRVQHEYVTVPVGAVNMSERNRLVRTRPTKESPSAIDALKGGIANHELAPVTRNRTVQRASRDQTLFEKARRAFIGNGRHRPEPFPRPRDNN